MTREQEIKMFRNYLNEDKNVEFQPKVSVKFSDVKMMADMVCSHNHIAFPDEVLMVYYSLLDDFRSETEKFISKRVAKKCMNIAKASALLNNRQEVEADDLREMRYVLCTLNDKSNESATFDASYGKAVAILKIKDEIDEIKAVAHGIVSKDLMTLNPGELIKLAKGSKLYIKQIDNISKTTGKQLPKTYQDELTKVRTDLANKINSLQKEIDKISQEASAA